jgi:glutamate racemase
MVEFVIQNPNIHHVGIIATKTTIASGVYQEKLSRRKSDLIYSTLATPLLAPMIEEGFIHNSISQSVLHEYLGHQELQDIDSLVLACTHYPLIKKEISDYYQDKILILDSAEIVAAKLKMIMQKEQLLNNNKIHKEHQFYVSDLTTSFQETTKVFYGQRIALREKKL